MLSINNVKDNSAYLKLRSFFLVRAVWWIFALSVRNWKIGNCQRLFLIYVNNCDCDPPSISRNLSGWRTLGYTEWFIIGVPYHLRVFVSTSFIGCTKFSQKIGLKQNLIPLYDQAN